MTEFTITPESFFVQIIHFELIISSLLHNQQSSHTTFSPQLPLFLKTKIHRFLLTYSLNRDKPRVNHTLNIWSSDKISKEMRISHITCTPTRTNQEQLKWQNPMRMLSIMVCAENISSETARHSFCNLLQKFTQFLAIRGNTLAYM